MKRKAGLDAHVVHSQLKLAVLGVGKEKYVLDGKVVRVVRVNDRKVARFEVW
jgi:hypothetical protein